MQGSKSLYADGAEVLYDFAERSSDPEADDVRQLVVVRHGQHVFSEVVVRYLRRIEFADDGYAQLIRLPGYQAATAAVDPTRGFGARCRRCARPADLQQRWCEGRGCPGHVLTGESLADVAIEYGVTEAQLEDALRVAT